ncbi:TrkH family potassium uptake protein [Desulfovulcanus sp.]
MRRNLLTPFSLPIYFFALTIFGGTALLHHPISLAKGPISWIDALFTATSATCVTGLTVVDTGSFFSRFGQSVILVLMQLGGLGIMTYTSLVFYLWRKKITITDRIAVGQSLLHDPSFHLGKFLQQLIVAVLFIELLGGIVLYFLDPHFFSPFSAIFHSVSAFCNAGFSLFSQSLMGWRSSWAVNLVFMVLIILGGLGFAVLMELNLVVLTFNSSDKPRYKISWQSRVVLSTTAFLILFGWIAIFLAEFLGQNGGLNINEYILTSLFQSVTCRTAGFNTLDIGQMTNISLLVMILLMFVGGSPGSCAGGIKTTTFRGLIALAVSNILGRKQCVIGKFALDEKSLNKVITLIIFAVVLIFISTLFLLISEGGDLPHPEAKGQFLEILFEVVSAFGTVGLSTGLTPKLTFWGKWIIIFLMFVGRLGPILFLTLLQSWQTKERFSWPENSLLIG